MSRDDTIVAVHGMVDDEVLGDRRSTMNHDSQDPPFLHRSVTIGNPAHRNLDPNAQIHHHPY